MADTNRRYYLVEVDEGDEQGPMNFAAVMAKEFEGLHVNVVEMPDVDVQRVYFDGRDDGLGR